METFKAHYRIEAIATIKPVKKETSRGRCTINRNDNVGVKSRVQLRLQRTKRSGPGVLTQTVVAVGLYSCSNPTNRNFQVENNGCLAILPENLIYCTC